MASGSIRLADAGHETQRCGIGERSVKAPAIVRADEGSITGPHRRDVPRICSIAMYKRPLCSKAMGSEVSKHVLQRGLLQVTI